MGAADMLETRTPTWLNMPGHGATSMEINLSLTMT
jgi:hypothetical protein